MPESKRQCSTCRFFQNAQLSGNGWCTHPKRQVASDVKILVRERELACRNTWGDDLWMDASSHATTSEVAPAARREFTYLNTRTDDEVTSVVDSGALTRPGGQSQDDIVTFTSVRPDETPANSAPLDHDVNSAAVADQEERARQMAMGSRHAIDSARARHARRWAPAKTGNEVTPGAANQAEPPVSDDQVINEDHRGTQSTEAASGDHRFEAAGPVPRAEIEAHGALPPLPDSEPEPARLDPTVSAGIDLPRLRHFFRPDERQAIGPATASTQPAVTSNFEHVIRQAERIKALSKSERAAHTRATPSPARRPEKQLQSTPAPTPVVATPPRADDVVWDMDHSELKLTFDRARAAIEHRPTNDIVHQESVESRRRPLATAEHEDESIEFDAGAQESVETAEFVPIAEPEFEAPRLEAVSPELELEIEAADDQDFVVDEMEPLDDWEYDDVWEEEQAYPIAAAADGLDAGQPATPERRESPRGSWWRSLNFGIKRRYEQEPAPADSSYEYDDFDPVQFESTTDWEPEPSHAGPAGQDQFADDDLYWHESPTEPDTGETGWPEDIVIDEIIQDEPPPIAAQNDTEPHFATSDESWLMDSREFPEPQPAGWRQSRNELLAQRPDAEPKAGVEWIEPPVTPRRRDQLQAGRTRPEPREFIPIDQPSGMDAFRDALFGGTASTGLSDAAEPYATRSTLSPPVFDEYEVEPAPRLVWRDVPEVHQEPEPHRWVEPEYEPTYARQASRGQARHRDNRRDRVSRSARAIDRQADDVFDIRRAVADPDDTSVSRQLDIGNGVAKCCLTCRSFQPGDEAGRGWCMNSWAATYRQMVNADTLACQSSIGNWWIAADTTWIPPSDSIQPRTPRTDRLVAQAEDRTGGESSKQPRVRTGKVG